MLDLIDMEEKKNRQKVFQEVEKELRKDRSPSKAPGIRLRPGDRDAQARQAEHRRQLTDPCPYCSGSGSIKSASTICYEILTEMKKIGATERGVICGEPDIARSRKRKARSCAICSNAREAGDCQARHPPATNSSM